MGAQLGGRQILLEALSLPAAAQHGVTGSLGASAAAKQNPGHSIEITPADKAWVATLGNVELARSNRARVLFETGYSPVVYFPPEDVRTEALIQSDTRTHCPFKGDASYWAAEIDGATRDIAWYYPRTFDEVSAIAGFIAFYLDRVAVVPASQAVE